MAAPLKLPPREVRLRVAAAATKARQRAFELYREEQARLKAEAEAKTAKTAKK
jgi:hypothetical protein